MFKFIEKYLQKRNVNKVKELLSADIVDWDLVKNTPHWVVDNYPATEVKKQTTILTGETITTNVVVVWNYEYNHTFVVVETKRIYWKIDDSVAIGSKTILGEVIITGEESVSTVHSVSDGCIIALLNITDTNKYIIKSMSRNAGCFGYTSATITDLNLVYTLDSCEKYIFSNNKSVLIDPLSATTGLRNSVKQWAVYDIEPSKHLTGFSHVLFYYVDETTSSYGSIVVANHTTTDWLGLNTFKQATKIMLDLDTTVLFYDTISQAASRLSKTDMYY